MALTYVEIEQEKSYKIFLLFAILIIFYFLTALILGYILKFFIAFKIALSDLGFAGHSIRFTLTPVQILSIFLVSLAAAIIHLRFSLNRLLEKFILRLGAKPLDRKDRYHQRLRNIVEEASVAIGSRYQIRGTVLPTLAMNAFALADFNNNAVIGVTEGLISRLNRSQLEAVVAHETAHIAQGDCLQNTITCSLFGVYSLILSKIRNQFESRGRRYYGRTGAQAMALMVVTYLTLSIFQGMARFIKLTISRQREYRADATAVRISRNPLGLAEALYEISRNWRGSGDIGDGLESLFIMNPRANELDESEGLRADLFSTHPPISKRIKILLAMAHSEIKVLEEKRRARERLKKARRAPKKLPLGRGTWYAHTKEGDWKGPYTLPRIVALSWFRPNSWVYQKGKGKAERAFRNPSLSRMLAKRIKGKATGNLICPGCNQYLLEKEYEGTTVYRCMFCGGKFLENDKVTRILLREEKVFPERTLKLAKEMVGKNVKRYTIKKWKELPKEFPQLKCPSCLKEMRRTFYSLAYPIEVDRCYGCQATWFDKDELEILQCAIENNLAGQRIT
ncbi:zinc metalloprotease HtpX [bacterium]|nr:zinc metalloprotease HtpX [bacterium]